MATKYGGKDLLIQRLATASAWVALTAYVVGQYVANSGNLYKCTTAGTSAASGGPSTTGPTVTDGSVTWTYVSASTAYQTVAAMRTTSVSINNDPVDVTTKSDVPWKQLLPVGIRHMELSAAGCFTNDDSHNLMMQDVTNGSIIQFKIISGRGDTFIGSYLVASVERMGEYNKEEQFTMKLQSAGTIVFTPGT